MKRLVAPLLLVAACNPSPLEDPPTSGQAAPDTTVVPMASRAPAPWPTTTTTSTVPTTTTAPPPIEVTAQTTQVRVPITAPWDALAACESHGEWDYGPHSGWGSGIYEGGLQFHPNTWDAYKPAGYPEAAYQATREQQIVVGEAVLAAQGWGAWPDCSRKLGLR